jgi:uncharacterized protein (TIGR04255 family)
MSTSYTHNFLANVICRADFPVNLRLGSEKPVDFQERLASTFPKASEGVILQAEMPDGVPQNIFLKQPVIRWEFFARDMGSRVTLQRDFVSIQTQKYHDFKQFWNLFEIPFQLLRDIYKPPVITRLGLRYQNLLSLKGDAADWVGCLVPPLIEHLKFEHGRILTKDSHSLQLDSEGIHINFKYGVHNPDYPGPSHQRQFALDIDCYIRDDIELDDVAERLKDLNKEATDVFERSIGESWRQLMRS